MVLGLGQGSSDYRLEYVNGYAFFDDVTCEVLTSSAFDDATASAFCNIDSDDSDKRFEGNLFSSVKIDLDADLGSADELDIAEGPAAITVDPDGGKSNVVYNGTYPDDYAQVTTAAALNTAAAGNSYLKNIYDTDFSGGFPFDGAADGMKVIMLMSVSGAPYTASSEVYTLGAHTHMMLSFWVKTSKIGGTGASATLVDGENRTQIAAFDSTTVATVDIDDETKDIYNGWVQCFFFVSNETDSAKDFRVEFSYGPTDVASAEQTAYDDGYAAFTNFEVLNDVNAKYLDYASTGTYAQKVSLTGAVDNDSAFDTAGINTSKDIRETLAPTANFTAVPNASKSIVTGGVDNVVPEGLEFGLLNAKYADTYRSAATAWSGALTDVANANAFTDATLSAGELWWAKIFGDYNADGSKASSRVANQPLVVLNTSDAEMNAYGFLSDTMTVAADSYQRISMRVKLSAGATATIYLIDTSDVKQGYNNPLTPTLPPSPSGTTTTATSSRVTRPRRTSTPAPTFCSTAPETASSPRRAAMSRSTTQTSRITPPTTHATSSPWMRTAIRRSPSTIMKPTASTTPTAPRSAAANTATNRKCSTSSIRSRPNSAAIPTTSATTTSAET